MRRAGRWSETAVTAGGAALPIAFAGAGRDEPAESVSLDVLEGPAAAGIRDACAAATQWVPGACPPHASRRAVGARLDPGISAVTTARSTRTRTVTAIANRLSSGRKDVAAERMRE